MQYDVTSFLDETKKGCSCTQKFEYLFFLWLINMKLVEIQSFILKSQRDNYKLPRVPMNSNFCLNCYCLNTANLRLRNENAWRIFIQAKWWLFQPCYDAWCSANRRLLLQKRRSGKNSKSNIMVSGLGWLARKLTKIFFSSDVWRN